MDISTQFWIKSEDCENIFSGEYWNNEEKEKSKRWYILNGGEQELLNYLKKETTLFDEYLSVFNFAKERRISLKGVGLDLAAGVCWTTALLSNIKEVLKVYGLDISSHRLLKIAPKVLDLFKADTSKIIRVIGSFYDIKLPNNSADFCFMSQAFHHASDPDRLLVEIRRVLKPLAPILMIGEKPISWGNIFISRIKNLVKIIIFYFLPKTALKRIKNKPIYKLFPKFEDLYGPDCDSGDHYYSERDYFSIFLKNGFKLHKKKEKGFVVFLAKNIK